MTKPGHNSRTKEPAIDRARFGKTRGRKTEFYPRAVLQHPEIPDALKVA